MGVIRSFINQHALPITAILSFLLVVAISLVVFCLFDEETVITEEVTTGYFWLSKVNIDKIYSNDIPEVEKSRTAEKLVDGDLKTDAYPGYHCCPSRHEFDYTIELTDKYEISRIDLVWGGDGQAPERIQWWSLEAKTVNDDWEIIESQNKNPGVDVTTIEKKFVTKALRIRAGSEKHWIGMYEVKMLGRFIPD